MSTTSVTLNASTYTDCGAGPLALISQAGPIDVLIYSNATAPAADADASAVLIDSKRPLNYQFTDKLWAKLVSGTTLSVRVLR